MLKYIRENKQWIFSGIGVFILGLIITLIISILRNSSAPETRTEPSKYEASPSSGQPPSTGSQQLVPPSQERRTESENQKGAQVAEQDSRNQRQPRLEISEIKPEIKKENRSGRILLLVAENIKGAPIADGMVIQSLSQKLIDKHMNISLSSEMNGLDLERVKHGLQRLQAGDKAVGSSIPFALIITGTISVTPLDPYNQLYVAIANGALKAIETGTGRSIAFENFSGIRGFGNTQDEAEKDALKKTCDKISQSFIQQISSISR